MMKKTRWLVSLTLVLVMALSLAVPSFAERDYSKMDLFFDYIERYYYQDVDEEEILDAVYHAMFQSLDNHSAYFTADQYQIFRSDSEGSFSGIGVTITTENRYVRVIQIFDDSPAKRAGLQVDDFIIAVDGESVADLPLDVAASMIRGEVGTDVTLTVRRGITEMEIVVTRDLIEIVNVEHEILDGNIGYLKIAKFSDNAQALVHAALRDFIQADIQGIVIDLRNNPGGLVDSVVKIAELFLQKDEPILNIDYKAFKDEHFVSNINGVTYPMVVLVNGTSASASEIFASAMQDNDRAAILGETTYGKGTVQTLIPISDGTGFKLTVAEYLSGLGNKIDGIGVIPDIEVVTPRVDLTTLAPMNQKRDIYMGEVSLNVYGAQQRLAALGHNLVLDGIFGPMTLKALNAFQEDQGMTLTNRLDLATVKALDAVVRSGENQDVVLEKALKMLR